MGKHSIPGSGESTGPDGEPSGRFPRADGGFQGRRRRTDAGRRGLSVGVVAALVMVVVLVGGIILWRFFGSALSRRSDDAAGQCLAGTATVAVVADPSIADTLGPFAEQFNAEATPVGDTCVNVTVKQADSDAVLAGLSATWPADLGEQPALWIPASSIPSARLQAAVGKQIVSDARSLVTSPVVLAVRPEVKAGLGELGWPALPGLQSNPTAMDGLKLPGWGSLRLALPTAGAADAAYLTAEAVATTSAPPDTSATAGLAAAAALLAGQPKLSDNTATAAWEALIADGDPAAAPVHAVALTEQQLYRRAGELGDASRTVAAWLPSGPAAVADYPAVLLSGPWLAEEQVAAASEFARFLRKPEQQSELVKAGFRAEGATPQATDILDFAPLTAPLPAADDGVRATVAGAVAPGGVETTTVMLDQSLPGVTGPLRDRIAALPPTSAVGLWTFDGAGSGSLVPTGQLDAPLGDQPRGAALAGALGGVGPGAGGAVSFTTLRLVYGDALAAFRPGQQNSVLVITQGPHTDRTLDGPGLQEFITSAADPARPVAVNVIDVGGGDPDRPTWEAVARASGGSYTEVPAADSPELIAAIARLLS